MALSRPERRARRIRHLSSIGGWLAAVAGAIALAAGAAMYARGDLVANAAQGGPATIFLAATVAFALAVAIVGLAGYIVLPGLDAAIARESVFAPRTLIGALAAVFVVGNGLSLPIVLASGGFDRDGTTGPLLSLPALVAAMLATQVGLMAVLIWRAVRPGALTWEEIGLTSEHLGNRVIRGVVGGFVIFALAGLVGGAMRGLGIDQNQARQFDAVRSAAPSQFIGIWLMASVVAPICEESFFRGWIFTALRARHGRVIAYAGSSLLFAAIHMNLAAIVPIVIMSLGLAFLYDRSRSVVPGVVAHGLNNGVALGVLYAGLGV
ncbi:MAG: CPBP family intramembrane metalloprotease [Chloroflexota bacterium]|nr:MAG: CPBP family intramembrane metalloprotease [Chloroflexota bacterium]